MADQRQQQQDENEQQQPPALRSLHNRQSSFVRFINASPYNVSVYWIDYQGKMVSYKVLGPRDYVDINTFVTHPWVFIEQITEDRFPANGQEIYFPEPCRAEYQGRSWSELPARIERTQVYVTLPLYTLRELCLRKIKRRLRIDASAFDLDLPVTLQRELDQFQPRKPKPDPRD